MVCTRASDHCQQHCKPTSFTRKQEIELSNKCLLGGEVSCKVAWQHDIKPNTLRKWINTVTEGRKEARKEGRKEGRPAPLSNESKLVLSEFVSSGVYNVKVADFIKKVHDLQIEDAKQCNKSIFQVKLMGRHSIFRKKLNLKSGRGSAEKTTFAWAEAIVVL